MSEITILKTNGLEEGIRCALCTNPRANDRGCDGNCMVNQRLLEQVMNVLESLKIKEEMSDLDEAIEELKKQYALAEEQEHVNDVLCFALYQTWKKFDVERKTKKRRTRAYKACEECRWLDLNDKTSCGYRCKNPDKEWRTSVAMLKGKGAKACKMFEEKGEEHG